MLDKLNSIKDAIRTRFSWRWSSSNILWAVEKIDEQFDTYMSIADWNKEFWEIHKDIKQCVVNPEKNRDFVLVLWDTSSWKPLYELLITASYNRLLERLKGLTFKERREAKKLLKEIKSTSLKIFSSIIEELQDDKNAVISPFRMRTLLLVLRGDSICFSTNDEWRPLCIQFDKDYLNRENTEQIIHYENSWAKHKSYLVARRHVDKWANLNMMEDILRKYAQFNKYFKQTKGSYVVTESWLNDKEFMEYYAKYLDEKWEDSGNKKILKNIKLTESLSIWGIHLFPLTDSDDDYLKRRQNFIKNPDKLKDPTSLQDAILKYEGLWRKLKECEVIMDLNKLK